MAPTNGTSNGRWVTTTILTVAALISGLVIGALQTRVEAEERFVPRFTYERDQAALGRKLDRIEQKLDALVRAVERNSARLEERR